MRVAFYSPMKPPDSPIPSGDRAMARNLIRALEARGHDVSQPSRFVSRDAAGDPGRQRRIAATGARLAGRILRRWRSDRAAVPEAWFTYHLYHKAPDWIGGRVSRALGIPYIVAEASHAPKQAGGKWDTGFRGAEDAIRSADAIVGLSSLDAACVMPLLDSPERYYRLRPFTDTSPFGTAHRERANHRRAQREAWGLSEDATVLLAVGMMRRGDKQASYRVLADALSTLDDLDWSLVVVGDGPARAEIEASFGKVPPGRLHWAGAQPADALPGIYAAADIMVWPAVNEAYGMALLEAQAAGLPVVAGRTGGVPDIVRDGETGLLTEVGNAQAFADAVRELLQDRGRRDGFGDIAVRTMAARHDIEVAADHLDRVLATAAEDHRA